MLVSASGSTAGSEFAVPADVGERFIDVQTYLFRIAGKNNWSLIVSNSVNSPLKEVRGTTVAEALDNYFRTTPFGYRLYENCLYIAGKRELDQFFTSLPELEMALPKGKARAANFNGIFQRIELPFLCGMLRGISGVEIRPADELRVSMMMRVKNMTWQRILLAIVHLNRFRITRTDFSILIFPEGA
jgi:hypothetical protein